MSKSIPDNIDLSKKSKQLPTKQEVSLKSLLSAALKEGYKQEYIPAFVLIPGIMLSLIYFILYIYSASSFPTGYAYSDELMATAYNLGLGRTPGQPIFTLIQHFVLNLPIPVTVAMRGAILSAVFQSLSLFISFMTSWIILIHIRTLSKSFKSFLINSKYDNIFASWLAAATAGVASLAWTYGSIAEIPAFGSCLISLIIFLAAKLWFFNNNTKLNLFWIWLVMGLAILNYSPVVFLLPLAIIVSWNAIRVNSVDWKKPVLIFTLALLFNLLLIVLLSYSSSSLNWKLERSFAGLISYFKSNDFGQNVILVRLGRLFFEAIPVYIKNINANYAWPVILLILLGLRFALIHSKKVILFLILSFLPISVIFPLLINWSNDRFTQVLILRQYAGIIGLFSLPLTLGIFLLLNRLSMGFAVISKQKKILQTAVILVSITLFALKISSNIRLYNADNLQHWGSIHKSTLEQLPRQGILLCGNESICGSLFFAQQAEKVRQDITIVPIQYPLSQAYLEKQNLKGFEYKVQPLIMFDYVTWNLAEKPVYITGMSQSQHDILGMQMGFSYYVSHGYWGEIMRELPMDFLSYDHTLTELIRKTEYGNHDLMLDAQKETIAQIHMLNGLVNQRMGLREEATEELNRSSNILHEIESISEKKIESYRTGIENQLPAKNWKPGSRVQNVDEIMEIVNQNLNKNNIASAFVGALGAVSIEPDNQKARLLLGMVYEKQGNYEYAAIEYNNVLRLNPDSIEAKQKLQALDTN